MSGTDIIYLVIFVVCITISAYFAACEIAFISLQRYKLEALVQKNVKGAKLVEKIKDRPERFLSTVLLGNNLVNITAASLATAIAVGVWGEKTGILLSTAGVTVIVLIFGEAIPKIMASHYSEKISLTFARSLQFISLVLTPFVFLLSWITSTVGKMFGAQPVGRSLISQEEIRAMISVGSREGTVEEAEAEMLHKVFEFGDRPAREIMVPRTEVIWLEKGTTVEQFFKVYQEHPYNRYPVFDEKRDNVIGSVSSKDMLMSLAKGTCNIDQTIDDVIRPAYFVPESKRISELMNEMRDKNFHMTVVVDEYGGTSGIVTLTQLVEEIVGDVKDELSSLDKEFEIIDESNYMIVGSMRIEDINAEMGLGLPEGDYDTAAGFAMKILGHIPKIGEHFRFKDLKVIITQMNGLKIEEIRVIKEKHAAPTNKV